MDRTTMANVVLVFVGVSAVAMVVDGGGQGEVR